MNAIPRWPYFAPSQAKFADRFFLSVSSPQASSKPRRLQPKRKASTADGGRIVEPTPQTSLQAKQVATFMHACCVC